MPGGDRIVVRGPGDAKIKEGERVGIRFEASDAHVFRDDGRSLSRTGLDLTDPRAAEKMHEATAVH